MKQNYGSLNTIEQDSFVKKQGSCLKMTVLHSVCQGLKEVLCFCFEKKETDENLQDNANNFEKTEVTNNISSDNKVSHNQFILRSSRSTSVDTALGSSIDSKGIFSFSDPELSDNSEELLSPRNYYYLNSPNSEALGGYSFFYPDANLHHVNKADF